MRQPPTHPPPTSPPTPPSSQSATHGSNLTITPLPPLPPLSSSPLPLPSPPVLVASSPFTLSEPLLGRSTRGDPRRESLRRQPTSDLIICDLLLSLRSNLCELGSRPNCMHRSWDEQSS
ncbi:hypothetical protein BO71DRAFT_158467 [Aspergillus ellipticus CBS 707.79]|uniref:Uncharacterized protein n=1 Tax=Aspergillus ellipticus CBS 707.79 TaxID=1448320 RepID=A0A319CT28_9EURO|nr:hypothetical protein BO71DRAFT_158467 [Aspergillus ellipticus CBS 707.79]